MELGFSNYHLTDLSGSADTRVSNNRGRNPAGALIHSTAGTDSLNWLLGGSASAGTPASCNELIRRNGEVAIICQRSRYPYHAGRSILRGANADTVNNGVSELLYGWELEYTNAQFPSYEQYDSLAQRVTRIAQQYGWRWPYLMYGHYGVASPPGRRADPYQFDWGALMGRLYVYAQAWDIPGL